MGKRSVLMQKHTRGHMHRGSQTHKPNQSDWRTTVTCNYSPVSPSFPSSSICWLSSVRLSSVEPLTLHSFNPIHLLSTIPIIIFKVMMSALACMQDCVDKDTPMHTLVGLNGGFAQGITNIYNIKLFFHMHVWVILHFGYNSSSIFTSWTVRVDLQAGFTLPS